MVAEKFRLEGAVMIRKKGIRQDPVDARSSAAPRPASPPLITRDHIADIRRRLPLTPEETIHALALAAEMLERLIRRLDRPMSRAPHDETRLGWYRMKQRLEAHVRRLRRQMRRMGEPEVQVRPTRSEISDVTWAHLFALYERIIDGTKDIRLRSVLFEIWGETAIEHGWLASWVVDVGDIDPELVR
ncbi:hypothetical protein CVV65_10205 [Kyrpidia spormannii]|uniref:Uncharacterized protein n=2 Tax=Kyrpidia spormannii TaxID=2055160 RepID=A0A2K8N9Z0_9BACL|nr:hypothetical protein CVV65_10205 [Kyrpidia spormannii]